MSKKKVFYVSTLDSASVLWVHLGAFFLSWIRFPIDCFSRINVALIMEMVCVGPFYSKLAFRCLLFQLICTSYFLNKKEK